MQFDFSTNTITPDLTTLLSIGGVGALQLASGTTAERPESAVAGAIRWNSTTPGIEFFNGSTWGAIGADAGYLLDSAIGTTVQGLLTSGSTLKTVDGISLLSSGDIDLSATYTTPVGARAAVGAITHDMSGWPNRTDTALAFDNATRTFTLSVTGASASWYHYGAEYTFSTSKTFQIPNVDGAIYININDAGALYDAGTTGDIRDSVLVAYVFWCVSTQTAIVFGDERHASYRDTEWHYNQHRNLGAVWRAGGSLTYTLNNDAAVSLALTGVTVADEDLEHIIVPSATPTLPYEQILAGTASIPTMYYLTNFWTQLATSTVPWVAGTSLARYNPISGGTTGSLADATEGAYISYWLFATNDSVYPIKLVMGRILHTSVDEAYGETFDSYGLTMAEVVPMYQIVLQTSAAYTNNSAKVQVKGVRQITTRETTSNTAFNASSHNSLTDRTLNDSHPISAITGLQTALNNKQDTLVSATNIKTINGTSLLGSGDLVISSGGTPGGVSGQVQFNNAGAFDGRTGLTYNSVTNITALGGTDPGLNIKAIVEEPDIPAAGTLTIYAKSIAGRMLPKWIGPSGSDTPFQALVAQNKIAWWNPPGNATTVPGVLGMAAPTAIGTATARNVAATNIFTRANRLGYNSSGTAGSVGGHFTSTAQYTIGTGNGLGGFYYVCRFGAADTVATSISFTGFSSATNTPSATASPATLTNCFGIGCATGDTNYSIYYGGSAAQTPIALGAGFPAKTTSTDLIELVLFAASNTNLAVGYRVTNLNKSGKFTGSISGTTLTTSLVTAGAVSIGQTIAGLGITAGTTITAGSGTSWTVSVSQTVSATLVEATTAATGILTAATAGTQLPAATTFLAHRAYRTNNATGTAVLIDVVSLYIEVDT